MKKVLILAILLLSTTVAFSQALKDNANTRLENAGSRAERYDAVIAEMEGKLHDDQNGREYHRITTKLNTLETDLLFLRRAFNVAQTPQERERILNSYKEKKSEYDSTRQELQQFIGTLK
jgi:TATA-binding protein-associated factor Taf7